MRKLDKKKDNNVLNIKKNNDTKVEDIFKYMIEQEEYDYEDDDLAHSFTSMMLPVVMEQSVNITKLIIENRIRNDEKMNDEDIYEIHRSSFKQVIQIFEDKNKQS